MPETDEQRERKNFDKATSYTGIWDRGEVAKARGFKLISPEEIDSLNDKWEKEYEDVEMTDAEWERKHWQLLLQAQLDSCEKQYQERLREIKSELETISESEDWHSFWKGQGL